ncbi:SIR2 family protein [Pedobacter metabolipauper]|uniref:SIR2-like protein n=1 Tax=Pedobacter metabolipauper TaxID=425513 RepID=A0A4R6SZK2_9SPHI|nr:SIR2 family protein [Pedobacter metabolipauper]TDQ11522.1 SIR2-like protein [Pedobacter metabolipauper]
MSKSYNQKLENLRKNLKNQSLSILIGAGFSKNANKDMFPTWWGLLKDMAEKINHSNYCKKFYNDTGMSFTDDPDGYADFIDPFVNLYMEELGFLNLVSKYIKFMGYRETVEIYIEERTPRAIIEKGVKYLVVEKDGKETKKVLSEHDLAIHNKLIQLPWNNIYTTNYDNLLEFCVDRGVSEGLEQKIKEYKDELGTNQKTIDELTQELTVIEQELEIVVSAEESSKIAHADSPSTKTAIDFNNSQELINRQSKVKSEIRYLKSKTDNINVKLNNLERSLDQCYNVVKHSSQLAIKRHRNIVKLHGSIRESADEEFTFDNDYHKRYVISQEDFDSYPIKHEAFTQLMRISLLQGHFCLIGFSGDDANFLAWVSWVRDIIKKSSVKQSSEQEDKIYFIDVLEDEQAGRHKQQFYDNHRIVHIPLMHEDTIAVFEDTSGTKIFRDSKTVLNAFLDYLHQIPVINLPQISFEVIAREKYENFAADKKISLGKDIDGRLLEDIVKDFYEVKALRIYNRIPSLSFQYDFGRSIFARSAGRISIFLNENKQLVLGICELMCVTIRDRFMPHSAMMKREQFDKFKQMAKEISNALFADYLLLDMKDAIWRTDKLRFDTILSEVLPLVDDNLSDELQFVVLLSKALFFEFETLDNQLETYAFKNHRNLNIIGLEWMFNRTDIASKFNITQATNQEELYALEFKDFLIGYAGGPSESAEKIKKLKHEGLKSIFSNFTYLTSDLSEKKEKPHPHGATQKMYSKGTTYSNINKEEQGFQIFGMLMETGLPVESRGYSVMPPEKIYPAILSTFKYYPVLVLFYALQYDDEKFIKLIGQDYSYNTSIDEDQGLILSSLFKTYLYSRTYWIFRRNILIFLAQYINVIDSKKWEDFFMSVWEEKKDNKVLFDDDRQYNKEFLKIGISLCSNEDIIAKIIIDCLDSPIKTGQNEVISFLYQFSNNPYLKLGADLIRQRVTPSRLNVLFESIIKSHDQLFVIGNLNSIFNDKDLEKIRLIVSGIDFNTIKSERIWRIITYYIKQDKVSRKRIVEAIINNSQLWNTGFFKQENSDKLSLTSGIRYIPLRELRKSDDGKYGLSLEKDEAVRIYNALKSELSKIIDFSKGERELTNFKFILQEMMWFLDDEKKLIVNEPDYSEVRTSVEQQYFYQKGNVDLWESLSSDDGTKVNWALSEVSKVLYDNKDFKGCRGYLNLIISRVQLKNLPGLTMCLEYLGFWCKNFKNITEMRRYNDALLHILKVYKNSYPWDLDQADTELNLVKIANTLRYWGENDSVVSHFTSLLEQSRYNNVRNLRYTIDEE